VELLSLVLTGDIYLGSVICLLSHTTTSYPLNTMSTTEDIMSPFTAKTQTPSEPAPKQETRIPSSSLTPTLVISGLPSKKNSLNTYDSPLHSVYPSTQGSDSASADDQSQSILLHNQPHGQNHFPASSAMAVHGSVPPSMMGYEGVFGVPCPQRGAKKTKWQEAGVVAEMLEEHEHPIGVKQEVDISLGDDKKDDLKNERVIALDFDDVCSQSMKALCDEHNALWGTSMNV